MLDSISSPPQNIKTLINQIKGNVDEMLEYLEDKKNLKRPRYENETNYTFQGGQNYRETVVCIR